MMGRRSAAAGVVAAAVGCAATVGREAVSADEAAGMTLEEPVAPLEEAEDARGGLRLWEGFEFHGYLRSGFGTDGEGVPIEAFKAPNAGAKYRLGNEAETYLETAFRQALVPARGATDFATQVRVACVTPTSESNDLDTTTTLPEAYGDDTQGISAGVQTWW